MGVFLVTDNRVFKRPLGRSLSLFARTAHSAHSRRSAPRPYACFAPSLHSRARSLTLLTFSHITNIRVHAEKKRVHQE